MSKDLTDLQLLTAKLEQLIQRHPVVADYGAWLQIRILHEHSDLHGVVRVGHRALARDPDTPLAPEIHERMGDALMTLGDGRSAQASWRRALDESRDGALRARVLLSIGAAEERAGLDDEAVQQLRKNGAVS